MSCDMMIITNMDDMNMYNIMCKMYMINMYSDVIFIWILHDLTLVIGTSTGIPLFSATRDGDLKNTHVCGFERGYMG